MLPLAFVSSLTTEHTDLRRAIFEDLGNKVWIAEYSEPDLKVKQDLEIVDTCADFIRRTDRFICVFAGRPGTRVKVGEYCANATHFETELFQAAMLGKEIHVFVAEGFEPHRNLRAILDVLSKSIDTAHWQVRLSDNDIRKHVQDIVGSRVRSMQKRLFYRLVRNLYDLRGRDDRQSTGLLTAFFLGDLLVDEAVEPNLALVQQIMETLDGEKDAHKQLSRVYIAYRELLARPFADSALLPYRNRLLGYWGTAASWYGLHGHIPSGVLAAAESMAKVRERLRDNPMVPIPEENLAFPGGVLASALYSVSKHLQGKRRREILKTGLKYLSRSLQEGSSREADLLAIRGSIFRLQGQIERAVADYERVVRLRERSGASCSAIGEGLSELGFGYLRQWHWWKGRDYLEKGVKLLRKGGPSGFLVRALRKLAVAYVVTAHPMKARRTLEESRRIAREGKMFDQLR